jgi:hypothetical protein
MCMCERGEWGECWCTCYSTIRCTIMNRTCRIRQVCIFCEHERGSKGEGATKCYTQKHECQFRHSVSEPVALFALLRQAPSDVTSLQSRPRTSEVQYFPTACTRMPSSALLHNALRSGTEKAMDSVARREAAAWSAIRARN